MGAGRRINPTMSLTRLRILVSVPDRRAVAHRFPTTFSRSTLPFTDDSHNGVRRSFLVPSCILRRGHPRQVASHANHYATETMLVRPLRCAAACCHCALPAQGDLTIAPSSLAGATYREQA